LDSQLLFRLDLAKITESDELRLRWSTANKRMSARSDQKSQSKRKGKG
jgi:hypothetical protein